jgi:DNA-binding MarR family transcriptional regulator
MTNTSAVAQRLHKATLRLLRILRLEDAHTGIGPAQLSALSVLVFAGEKTLGALAAAEGVKAPTMSRIVASLVRARLVSRTEDPDDGRRILLAPTKAGRRLMLAGRDRRLRRLDGLIGRLSSGEVEALDHAAGLIERLLA